MMRIAVFENSGIFPDPSRSVQPRVPRAKVNIAKKTPSDWNNRRSRVNQRAMRGE
jgi:hypothetical protein